MDDLIGPFQANFIPGRSIVDGIIIVQECTHTIRKNKSESVPMALKIDLAKAYDWVDWRLLKDTLIAFDFPELTVKVIMNFVEQATFSLLWNREKLPNFRAALRRPPLSLFVCPRALPLNLEKGG